MRIRHFLSTLDKISNPRIIYTNKKRRLLSNMAAKDFPSAIFDGQGRKMSQSEFSTAFADKISSSEIVFIGEIHDDPSAHKIEADLLRNVHDVRGSDTVLSLEFYTREAQTAIDEYLEGFIEDPEMFVSCANGPHNWKDYQSLIDFCKENKLGVIGSNCSMRYTRIVARRGRDALSELVQKVPSSSKNLPPLPYSGATDEYRANFMAIMASMGSVKVPESKLDAQSLWDATMAFSIADRLNQECDNDKKSCVVHVTGNFHVEKNLGIASHLKNYTKDGSTPEMTTLVIKPVEEDVNRFDEDNKGLADFVIQTDLGLFED